MMDLIKWQVYNSNKIDKVKDKYITKRIRILSFKEYMSKPGIISASWVNIHDIGIDLWMWLINTPNISLWS